MLTRVARAAHLARFLLAGFVVVGLCAAGVTGAGPAWADSASSDSAPSDSGANSSANDFGLTGSWLPTTSPVQASPGQTTHATFWVTNRSDTAIPVTILPATAVPGNNGALAARRGVDKRLANIVYSPRKLTAAPKSTTAITVTATIPDSLAPGVYLLLAIVHPDPPKTSGNIRTQQEIVVPVTFQIPGAIDASLKPEFLDATITPNGFASYHFPGLPEIHIGSTGTTVLRVLNNSSTSLYSYNEITSTQTPWAAAVFTGHTTGAPNNLRTDVALYFPGLHRDYPVVWTPSPLGFGLAHLTAYVSYHPTPSTIAQTKVSIDVLVISPWWLFAIVFYLLVVLLSLRGRTSRQSKLESGSRRAKVRVKPRSSSTPARVAGSLVLALVIFVTACFSSILVFAITGAAGVVFAAIGARTLRVRDSVSAARWILVYLAMTGLILVAAVATLLLAVFSTWSITDAVAILAGAGVWTLLASLAQWWNEKRPGGKPDRSCSARVESQGRQ